jgi:hypothetical protein
MTPDTIALWIMGGLLTVVTLLAGMWARTVLKQIEHMSQKVDGIFVSLTSLQQFRGGVDVAIDVLNKRVDALEARLERETRK